MKAYLFTRRGGGHRSRLELSLIELHAKGCSVKTEYDKPDDPPSKDATMLITVTDPLSEPWIHKDFPGGPVELQEYVMEVCDGIKDHLVRDPGDPADTRLGIHLSSTPVPIRRAGVFAFDQIETSARNSQDFAHARAQAITWKVWEDNDCYDPALLAKHLVPPSWRRKVGRC